MMDTTQNPQPAAAGPSAVDFQAIALSGRATSTAWWQTAPSAGLTGDGQHLQVGRKAHGDNYRRWRIGNLQQYPAHTTVMFIMWRCGTGSLLIRRI